MAVERESDRYLSAIVVDICAADAAELARSAADVGEEDQNGADVSLVIGANDVTNPDARNKADSPIYGMPILNVDESHSVIVLERSMSSGFAGIDNPLCYNDRTAMLFGDAKASVSEITEELKAV